MTAPFTITPLAATQDRSGFDSGVSALDRYFREQVMQDIRRRVSNGFVATDQGGAVVGFYTLAATGLPMTDLSPEETRRLPRYPLLPAALIGRLAVSRSVAGRGLGSALVVDALSRSIRAEPAIFAVIVDAKDDTAAAFYRHLGFRAFTSRPLSLFLTLAEAAKRLAMSA